MATFMFIATLLTNPAYPSLDASLVENLRNAWGGGTVDWLSPDEAAEFPLPARPDNLWQTWSALQSMDVDLTVQPAHARRKSILLADMDSTMIQQECIDELAAEAGVGDEVAHITARAMNGELDFEAAIIERVGLLKGLAADVIDEVIKKRITLMPGGPTLLYTMKENGAYCALVSGGFTPFTQAIASRLGFDHHRANTLLIKNGILTGEVGRPILGRDAKIKVLQELCAARNTTPQDVLAVGDGANDLGMLKLAGTGVALHAKPSVAEQCDIRINHGDLTALLYLQGYRKSDFARAPSSF